MTTRLLLDTNALLWLLAGDDRLGPASRAAVTTTPELVVSVASLWEVAIKVSLGKLAPVPELGRAVGELGFVRLDIADSHLAVLERLPFHHRDPFDRLLLSQATAERLTLLSADQAFAAYDVPLLDARR